MRKSLLTYLVLPLFSYGQPYQDYIGAGHSRGIKVTTSSNEKRTFQDLPATGENTIDGSGLEGRLAETARLLQQSAIGFSKKDLDLAAQMTPQEWIDYQVSLPLSSAYAKSKELLTQINTWYLANGRDSSEIYIEPGGVHFRYAWWNNAILEPDQLRQKMAFALSQILVISDKTDLGGHGDALGGYYDVLAKHAFGNFKDLLYDIALHPAMGFYLSHLNNPKTIPEENIHPDQNFAREIMQLFTIGIYELNIDGSVKLDANGNAIPTYNNEDIAELAKVFTGLSIGETYSPEDLLYFGRGIYGAKLHVPMIMYDDWHEQGPKNLINGYTIPGGQTGIKDISDAINHLFNHPNVGPFICRQLIQRFVTSNPSPDYIERVAKVFNQDDNGVRGNLLAVIKAILLDTEARNCDNITTAYFGKMSEPVIRYAHFLKAVGISSPSGTFLDNGYGIENDLFQHPLSAPSVFNFYLPDHAPLGDIGEAGLVAPEFQIYNSLSAISYPNYAYSWNYGENITSNWEPEYFYSHTNSLDYIQPSFDTEILLNKLDLMFCNGNMSEETRDIIREALSGFHFTLNDIKEKINLAIYLTLISPDFLIQK